MISTAAAPVTKKGSFFNSMSLDEDKTLQVHRHTILGCFDSMVGDTNRWLQAYRSIIEFFGGCFIERIAREEHDKIVPGGKVDEVALKDFHTNFDALLATVADAQDIRKRHMIAMMEQLAENMKRRSLNEHVASVSGTLCTTAQIPKSDSPPPMPDRLKALTTKWHDGGCQREFRMANTYVFDCDGVLWNAIDPFNQKEPKELQKDIMVKVNQLLHDDSKRCLFLTNNSHLSRVNFVHRLQACGVDFGNLKDESTLAKAKESIVTAGFTTAKLLKQRGIKKPLVLTSTVGILQELDEIGITEYYSTFDPATELQKGEYMSEVTVMGKMCDQLGLLMEKHRDVDAVVVGWDFNLNILKIGLAVNCIKWAMEDGRTIPLITCSADSSGVLGTVQGRKVRAVGNGAMGYAIAQCFDPCLDQEFCGKPSKALLTLLSDTEADGGYGVDLRTAVMIGDTIETDIMFANAGNMMSLFVLTGVNSLDDMEKEGEPHRKAKWILPSFADV